MKDVVVSGSWGRRPLEILDVPVPQPCELRIRVEAARGNPVDIAFPARLARGITATIRPLRASGGAGTTARLAAEAGGRTAGRG